MKCRWTGKQRVADDHGQPGANALRELGQVARRINAAAVDNPRPVQVPSVRREPAAMNHPLRVGFANRPRQLDGVVGRRTPVFRAPAGGMTERDSEHVEAEVTDGVLTLRLPKAESARPKQIKIKSR